MLRALLRLLLALGGAAAAAVVVALLESRAVTTAAVLANEQPLPPAGGVLASELGLFCPIALVAGTAVTVLAFMLRPQNDASTVDVLDALREGAAEGRLSAAAAMPVGIFAVFGWCVGAAHLARVGMEAGKPGETGLSVGVGAVGVLVASLALAFAFLPLVRRILAGGSRTLPQLLDPTLTGSLALIVVALLFSLGIFLGDSSGAGGGALGIFGVLKRSELDLRPVANAGLIALGALLALAAFSPPVKGPRGRTPALAAAFAIALHLVLFGLCLHAATALNDAPTVTRAIEKHAPVGNAALALLRRLTDHDKDGFSASFGGGDCNDHDPKINPNAIDVPGNGIDEDCSGQDTPAEVKPVAQPVAVKEPPAKPKRTFNVIFFTVDTLRPDLGFYGYDKPVSPSPNLDKVAEKATVFDNAYSMASYTGKAVGPMLIGKYPSETHTDFNHFNIYADTNTFVAERLHDAGVRTFAGMCHWYFKPSSGLKQGFDVWDTSAIPPGMGDNDTSVSSERLADLALKLLQRPENTGTAFEPADGGAPDKDRHGFFAWFHFFDPHAQYVGHEGSPDFTPALKGPYAASRNLYDKEIWYTDKHIGRVLDYVASQPWAEDTAIVFTADHGEAFFEHGMMWHGSEIWQELVHVPLMLYVPGAEPHRIKEKRSHIDIAPTILDLMGVPQPEEGELRGKSLLPDVYLAKGTEPEDRDVYIDMPQGPFNGVKRALVFGGTPGMKLIHSGAFNYQLFDLEKDPDERKDLSPDRERLNAAIKNMNVMRSHLKEVEVKHP